MSTLKLFQFQLAQKLLVSVSLFYPTGSYAMDSDLSDSDTALVAVSSPRPVDSVCEDERWPPAQQEPQNRETSVGSAGATSYVLKLTYLQLDKLHNDTLDQYQRQEVQFEENYKPIAAQERKLTAKERKLWDDEQQWDADIKGLKEDREKLKARQLITEEDRQQQLDVFDQKEALLTAKRRDLDARKTELENEKTTLHVKQKTAFVKQQADLSQFQMTMKRVAQGWAALPPSSIAAARTSVEAALPLGPVLATPLVTSPIHYSSLASVALNSRAIFAGAPEE